MSSNQDTLGNKFTRLVSGNIPGKNLTAIVYYKNALAEKNGDPEKLKKDLQNRLKNLDRLSKFDLMNLGTDLSVFFVADRKFREGWVIDSYWDVYSKLDRLNQNLLSGISGW